MVKILLLALLLASCDAKATPSEVLKLFKAQAAAVGVSEDAYYTNAINTNDVATVTAIRDAATEAGDIAYFQAALDAMTSPVLLGPLETGGYSIVGSSTDIVLEQTGAGDIKLVNGTEGTPGEVWTSTAASGAGAWAAPAAASTTLNDAYTNGNTISPTASIPVLLSAGAVTTGTALDINATALTTGTAVDVDVGADDRTRAINTDGRLFLFGDVSSAGYLATATEPFYPGASNLAFMEHINNASTTTGGGLYANINSADTDALGLGSTAVFANAASTAGTNASMGVSATAINGNAATGVGLFAASDLGISAKVKNNTAANTSATLSVEGRSAAAATNALINIVLDSTSPTTSLDSIKFTRGGEFKTADRSAASTNTRDLVIKTGNAAGATSDSGNIVLEPGTATGAVGVILVNGGLGLSKQTSDPCATYPEAAQFYNDTSDYMCFCNGAGDDKQVHSPATDCF